MNKKANIWWQLVWIVLALTFLYVGYKIVIQPMMEAGKATEGEQKGLLAKLKEGIHNMFGGKSSTTDGTGGTGGGTSGATYENIPIGGGGGAHTSPGGAGEFEVKVLEVESDGTVLFGVSNERLGVEMGVKQNEEECSRELNLCISLEKLDRTANTVDFTTAALYGTSGKYVVYGQTTRVYKDKKYPMYGKTYTLEYYKLEGKDAWFNLLFLSGNPQNCDALIGKDWWIAANEKCFTCCKNDQNVCGVIEKVANDKSYVDFKLCNSGDKNFYCGVSPCG